MILELIYLMLPAYLANMMPVFVRNIRWSAPVDFGLKFGGKRVLGDNKTWKGLFFGVAAAVFVAVLQYRVFNLASLELIPNAHSSLLTAILVGFLLGAGALAGDLVKSFFKRRFSITPGKSWFPFDQIDYSIGALLFLSVIYFPGWLNSFLIILVNIILHVLANHIGFYLNLRDSKW